MHAYVLYMPICTYVHTSISRNPQNFILLLIVTLYVHTYKNTYVREDFYECVRTCVCMCNTYVYAHTVAYIVTCQPLSYNKIPFYDNHIEASITTKLILAYS